MRERVLVGSTAPLHGPGAGGGLHGPHSVPAPVPALSSQIIIVMLGSAVCSQIATEELSFAANFIQSRNFRAFETYALTTLVYLCMALMIRQLLNWIGRRFVMRNSR